eukprot:2896245-Prymnesium_polylepis.1
MEEKLILVARTLPVENVIRWAVMYATTSDPIVRLNMLVPTMSGVLLSHENTMSVMLSNFKRIRLIRSTDKSIARLDSMLTYEKPPLSIDQPVGIPTARGGAVSPSLTRVRGRKIAVPPPALLSSEMASRKFSIMTKSVFLYFAFFTIHAKSPN